MATILIAVAFGAVTWAFCGSLVGVGRRFMSMDMTLIVHAVGAPIGAAVFAWLYFKWFGDLSPVQTAAVFVVTSLALDVFVVAMLIEKSFEMFKSVLGVWIPQALIFTAAFLTGYALTSSTP